MLEVILKWYRGANSITGNQPAGNVPHTSQVTKVIYTAQAIMILSYYYDTCPCEVRAFHERTDFW